MASHAYSHQHDGKTRRSAHWNVNDFLAVVSHELRNSTNAIICWADYLCRAPVSKNTLAVAAEAIKRNGKLQAELVGHLLNLSTGGTAALQFDPRSIDLMPVVEAAIETMAPQAVAKSVELHANLDSTAYVLGDPLRLQEVFTNLLSNAIKFTPAGGLVELRYRYRRKYAQITVRDTGCGISAQFLPYVFNRFRQEKANTAEPCGLGLGLAIARYIVERHQGRIYAISRGVGMGTTFRVYLPLDPHNAAAQFNPLWPRSTDKLP